MDKKMIMFGALVLMAIVVVGYGASRTFRKEIMPYSPSLASPQTQTMIVTLDPQNDSGEMGVATLTDVSGKTQVILKLSGAPKDEAQPAHIHTGTCAMTGGVEYSLISPTNGESTTVLDVPMSRLLRELPLAVNVHKSAREAGVYYACGDIAK